MKVTYNYCQNRECGKTLSEKKKTYHAKFCNNQCKWGEYELAKKFKALDRYTKTLTRFEKFDQSHPKVYEWLKGMARASTGRFSTRGAFYEIRKKSGVRIDNTFSRFYSLQLKEDFPTLDIELRGER